MSVAIWPHVAPEHLKEAVDQTQVSFWMAPSSSELWIYTWGMMTTTTTEQHAEDDWILVLRVPEDHTLTTEPSQQRELEWLLNELRETLEVLKSGLEECYALLAPVEPGSTLVVSTPRAEIVKGHVTRVGTKIVKGVRTAFSFPSSSRAYTCTTKLTRTLLL